ncbi:YrzI family small protein [Bacillus sonorensis]|uniref:YrzI family small protein n=1 Tax=Bacillus sonorensis TaxID=119858 RepID=UPI002283291B|nr:YrzI family small protein [Bacillus sonorensis]MCY7858254.1 YrzI family small protein [Bacillus sonorensis]
MTIDLFFITLTVREKSKSPEEYEIEEIYNEMRDRWLRYLYRSGIEVAARIYK